METKNMRLMLSATAAGVEPGAEIKMKAANELLDIAVALIDGLGRLASAIEAQNKVWTPQSADLDL